jgi:hypothetical protein
MPNRKKNKYSSILRALTCSLFISLCLIPTLAEGKEVYQEPAEFIKEVFGGQSPKPSMLAIIGERRKKVSEILDHPPSMLRTRYWREGSRSAWILEEIGKTKPITVGIVVDKSQIEDIRVLIYRESHGAEVRHSFFTQQFAGVKLDEETRLTETIDGISGATLSVYALKKLATLALYFDSEIRSKDEPTK